MFREKRSIQKSFAVLSSAAAHSAQLGLLNGRMVEGQGGEGVRERGERGGYITLCERHFVFDKHNWRLSAEERGGGERERPTVSEKSRSQ